MQRRVVPGIQEHENRAQLSPEKGYLIENESEIYNLNISQILQIANQIIPREHE